MKRVAAVRPNGTIARVVVGSSDDAIAKNIPTGTVQVDAPEEVRFNTHTFDFATQSFRAIDAAGAVE